MGSFLENTEPLLFGVFPYLAMFVFFLVTIQRYRAQSFSYSSLSSQFLENQLHFWGMVPFHYGILVVLTGHLIAFLFPAELLAWNRVPFRLYILEITGLVFAIFALVGLLNLIVRRRRYSKIATVTTGVDWLLLALLAIQIGLGIYVAVAHRWGSSWFAASLTPYLWSLIKLNPDINYISGLPLIVKLHVLHAFIILTLFPFTRLVHVLVVPNPYLWRRTQVVRWYTNHRKARIVS